MVPQTALVLRDGGQHTVPSENLCVGDVVQIKGGDRLPGDIRVVECKSFKVIDLYVNVAKAKGRALGKQHLSYCI